MKRKAPKNTLKKTNELTSIYFNIRKINSEKQIVYGEVYAPNLIDSHREMMFAEDVELMAHRFMADNLQYHIDIMHNNAPANAVAVESFIARETDLDYLPGAWVMGVKINDPDVWGMVKEGKLNGYSVEIMVKKVPVEVEVEVAKYALGFTEPSEDHDHVFYVEFDEYGIVKNGYTSEDNGHSHKIHAGTATDHDSKNTHSHRFFIT